MREELKEFNINLEDIKENNNLFDNIHEAIEKMKLATLSDRFEVVLNNNLIESKEKLTNFRTILGCRISYDNLDKNISFIVREDNKPSYEDLENKVDRLNNIINELENRDNVLEDFEKWLENQRYRNNEWDNFAFDVSNNRMGIPIWYLKDKIQELKEEYKEDIK